MIGQFSQDKAHYLMGEMDLGPDPTLGKKRQEWYHLIFAIERKDRWKSQLYAKQGDHVFD